MREFLIVGGVLLALAALFFLVLYLIYRRTFYNNPRTARPMKLPGGEQYAAVADRSKALADEFRAIPFERVTVRSFDGLTLFGRYYPGREKNAPLQIQLHGYRGSAMRDFSGGNKLARESGQATLVVDQRAHGESEGRTISFGVLERRDLLSWVAYATARFGEDTPIFLTGLSMGAATVLMAAELPLPPHVVGIIADCPYSSPREIIRRVCRVDYHLPPALVYPLIRLSARLFGHFDLDGASAITAVRSARVPILLLHGEDDRFVPCEMGRAIAAAGGGRVTCLTFPGAGHGLSYMTDTPRYTAAVAAFMRDCLAGK